MCKFSGGSKAVTGLDGIVPYHVRIDAPRRAQHQVKLPAVALDGRHGAPVPHVAPTVSLTRRVPSQPGRATKIEIDTAPADREGQLIVAQFKFLSGQPTLSAHNVRGRGLRA